MHVEETKDILIKISLTESEAKWLRSFVQNSYTEEEDSQHAQYRYDLFNALKSALA